MMRSARQVTDELRARGALWEPATGLVAMRGAAAALLARVERALCTLSRAGCADEWRVPHGIPLETLHRAGYFASFPQWLTVASHLGDTHALERLAAAPSAADAREAIAHAMSPPRVALAPAVCYHVYAALQGSLLEAPMTICAEGGCWRHEGDRHAPLERGWAFTMRESICIGTDDECTTFRERGIARVHAFARLAGLDVTVEVAADPFFAPTARGRALLQRVKALKHELLVPLGDGRRLAIASFNHHERFFGQAFAITASDGAAASACVAFGIERWLLALLVAHGVDHHDWPDLDDAARRACDAIPASLPELVSMVTE